MATLQANLDRIKASFQRIAELKASEIEAKAKSLENTVHSKIEEFAADVAEAVEELEAKLAKKK